MRPFATAFRHRPRLTALALAVLPIGLGACAASGMTVTYNLFYDYRYYGNQVSAGGGPLPVEVRGAPPTGETPEQVVAAIRLPAHINRGVALAKPGDQSPRLVIAFAPASGAKLCTPGAGPTLAKAELTISAAYCVYNQPWSSGVAEARGSALPDALKSVVRAILPLQNPQHLRVRGGR